MLEKRCEECGAGNSFGQGWFDAGSGSGRASLRRKGSQISCKKCGGESANKYIYIYIYMIGRVDSRPNLPSILEASEYKYERPSRLEALFAEHTRGI